MKNRCIVLAALGTLNTAGCMADEPSSDSDQPVSAVVDIDQDITATVVGYHQIVNLRYNQCMDAPNGTLNVVLKLSNCTSSTTQGWTFVAASSPNTFFLVNQRSGYCAEVNNGTNIPGELVDQWYCDGSMAEQWVQSYRTIGGVTYHQYTHAGTNLCLDTVSGPGSQLMQWYCDSYNDAQTWLVR